MKKKSKITLLDFIISLLILSVAVYVAYRIKIGLNYNWHWESIPQYLFRYDQDSKKWVSNLLMYGLFNTVRLSIWGTILATLIGTAMGFCRMSHCLFNRLIGRTYVELIRNLPPLILIF